MICESATMLCENYEQVSNLAKTSAEPIFITQNGEVDGVYMSMEVYEEREKLLQHRDAIYAAEFRHLSGEPTLMPNEVRSKINALFDSHET